MPTSQGFQSPGSPGLFCLAAEAGVRFSFACLPRGRPPWWLRGRRYWLPDTRRPPGRYAATVPALLWHRALRPRHVRAAYLGAVLTGRPLSISARWSSWQLAGFISRRSQVRILPAQPTIPEEREIPPAAPRYAASVVPRMAYRALRSVQTDG